MNAGDARPPLRVALVQLKPRKGDVAANLQAVATTVATHASETDLVIFPESALSGYFL